MADENAGKTLNSAPDSGEKSKQNVDEGAESQVGVKLTRYSTLKNRKKKQNADLQGQEIRLM